MTLVYILSSVLFSSLVLSLMSPCLSLSTLLWLLPWIISLCDFPPSSLFLSLSSHPLLFSDFSHPFLHILCLFIHIDSYSCCRRIFYSFSSPGNLYSTPSWIPSWIQTSSRPSFRLLTCNHILAWHPVRSVRSHPLSTSILSSLLYFIPFIPSISFPLCPHCFSFASVFCLSTQVTSIVYFLSTNFPFPEYLTLLK